MKKLLSTTAILFLFFLNLSWAISPKTIVIKKETDRFIFEIKYPQGFADQSIDTIIQKFISTSQIKAEKSFNMPDELPAEVPGKNGLTIDYKMKFQNNKAVSVLFLTSIFHRGAAHPQNTIKIFNFIAGKETKLNQLFKPGSHYLTQFSAVSRAALLKEKIANQDWVISGTKATQENYRNWYFSTRGLKIVFDTYQVAPYMYGPQTVEITKAKFKNWLQPGVDNAVWGNE